MDEEGLNLRKAFHHHFDGQLVTFFIVAVLASGHAIVLAGGAATNDGRDMIHGQLFGFKFALAVVANALA